MQIYDHGADWITHSSMQRVDYYKTAEMTDTWRKNWNKPVVVDECAYEGNNDHAWGNITGEEMTRRFWEGTGTWRDIRLPGGHSLVEPRRRAQGHEPEADCLHEGTFGRISTVRD